LRQTQAKMKPQVVLLGLLLLVSVLLATDKNYKRLTANYRPKLVRKVKFEGAKKKVPIYVMNTDATSFEFKRPPFSSSEKPKKTDVVIVGGGLAGLTAATYLTEDKNLNVVLIEKEEILGGIAAGAYNEQGIKYSRGAAYFTRPYPKEDEILKYIGIPDFNIYNITERIDSYYWTKEAPHKGWNPKDDFYHGIWEEDTLEKLPAAFTIFKSELQWADGFTPNQPMENYKPHELYDLDTMTAKEWISTMPCHYIQRRPEGWKKVWKRFIKESGEYQCQEPYDYKIKPDTRMINVTQLLDLYSRSALGTTTAVVNALAFSNFYISELEVRYCSDLGTQHVANMMVKKLVDRPNFSVKMKSMVHRIDPKGQKNIVTFTTQDQGGYDVTKRIIADYVVYASQLGWAPKVITGFRRERPEQAELLEDIPYVHYDVHEITVKGHPFRATYDTWIRPYDYTENDSTDLILGRWQEFQGYVGYRSFKKDPSGNSIFTVYHQLPKKWAKKAVNDEEAADWAEKATHRMIEIVQPLATAYAPENDKEKGKIEVISVTTSRWPFSIHLATPGHFTRVKQMRKHYRNIYFAQSSLGTPSFEEALYRGYKAAKNIKNRINPEQRTVKKN